ncbi:MAG: hypothetical protein HQK96_17595 [Nitrospirae bacterium]|nr:hypothetical protein [Nitrospirota bacterium]
MTSRFRAVQVPYRAGLGQVLEAICPKKNKCLSHSIKVRAGRALQINLMRREMIYIVYVYIGTCIGIYNRMLLKHALSALIAEKWRGHSTCAGHFVAFPCPKPALTCPLLCPNYNWRNA